MSRSKRCSGYTGPDNSVAPHKYHKVLPEDISKLRLWSCANCSHYMPTHLEHLLEGRISICWNCNKTFRLTEESMNHKSEYREAYEPICDSCLKGWEPKAEKKLEDLIEQLNEGKSFEEIIKGM